jgi:hypothetical protein
MRTKISHGGEKRMGIAEYIGGAVSGALLAVGFIVITANYFGLI